MVGSRRHGMVVNCDAFWSFLGGSGLLLPRFYVVALVCVMFKVRSAIDL
jgi:hypothetical protein